MFSIGITLWAVIFTALSSAEHDEQPAVADPFFLSKTPPSVRLSDELDTLSLPGDEASMQDSQALREREIAFRWYSHYRKHDYLHEWTFGNATNQFNISISTHIHSSDVAGIYQFMNGSTSNEATAGDIFTDLGYHSPPANMEKMRAQTLINAQVAYNEISTFLLDSILCSGSSEFRDELRRKLLFTSDGRVTTLILQCLGATVAYFFWNGIGLLWDEPGIKLVWGSIANFSIILVLGVLSIFQQEGVIQPYEAAFVGSLFAAKARYAVWRARRSGRAGQAAGTCVTGAQLAAAVAQTGPGSGSGSDSGSASAVAAAAAAQEMGVVASADVSQIQVQCAHTE